MVRFARRRSFARIIARRDILWCLAGVVGIQFVLAVASNVGGPNCAIPSTVTSCNCCARRWPPILIVLCSSPRQFADAQRPAIGIPRCRWASRLQFRPDAAWADPATARALIASCAMAFGHAGRPSNYFRYCCRRASTSSTPRPRFAKHGTISSSCRSMASRNPIVNCPGSKRGQSPAYTSRFVLMSWFAPDWVPWKNRQDFVWSSTDRWGWLASHTPQTAAANAGLASHD